MENLIFFVLGTIFAAGLIGLWFLIKQVLKISRKTETLENNVNINVEVMNDSFDEVHKRIDEVRDELESKREELQKSIDKVYTYVDSRLDKTIGLLSELVQM
jgi:malate synthase